MTLPTAVDPDAARAAAREILGSRRFRPEAEPRPLEGVLRWIGDRVDEVLGPIGRFLVRVFRPLFELFPGWLGTLVGILVTGAIAGSVLWLILRNRVHADAERARRDRTRQAVEDPGALDREADAAAAAGDYARAVRLRYRAGLLRLDRRGAATVRPWSTNATVARQLHSVRFDALTGTFETVAYGNGTATPEDAVTAAREWPTLLEEVGAS